MVKERRLVPMEEDELLKKARATMVSQFGAKTIAVPDKGEWDTFEDIYFELKDLVAYSPDAGQKYNSMCDLAMLAWNLKAGHLKSSEPVMFVTENASILAAAARIQERTGVRIVALKDLERLLKEEENQQGPHQSTER